MKKQNRKSQVEELDLFGLSSNENYYMSELWGRLEFFPTKTDDNRKTCRHCLLANSDACLLVKCQAEERKDGRNGYFSIHDYPRINTKSTPNQPLINP